MKTVACQGGQHDRCPGLRLVSYKNPEELDYRVDSQRCGCFCHQYGLDRTTAWELKEQQEARNALNAQGQ